MKQKKEVLMKNNALIKARYDISVYENKLFILILHKLQKINETTCQCTMKTDEIKKTLNARAVRNRKEISTILSGLRKGAIYFRQENTWGEFGFINGYVYNEEEDAFVVQASEKVHGLLRSYMKDGYTPINMQLWLSLRSSYAQRLYDLLRLWSGTKAIINYKLDELKELLMLEEKYPKYAEFKRRVIQPAINELNKTGYFYIEIVENKVSKKVNSIDFIVNDLDKRIYFNDKEDVSEFRQNTNKIIELPIVETEKKASVVKQKTKDVEIKNKPVTKVKEFYVPNKKLFTAKTLSNFIDDFKSYDFSDSKNKKILQDAILTTLEKDDEEKIKVKAYNYFKTTLEDKLNKTNIKSSKNVKNNVKTRFHNINQSFETFDAEDLERHLFEIQRQKGMQEINSRSNLYNLKDEEETPLKVVQMEF